MMTAKGRGARDETGSSRGKFTLLVAKDDAADRTLLDQLLVSAGLASVNFVSSGEAVIEYLAGRGEYADRELHPYPHVLLLDLLMPRGHGLEVLEWMANHAELPLCSVYILTGSRDPSLRRQAVAYGGRVFPKAALACPSGVDSRRPDGPRILIGRVGRPVSRTR